MTITPANYFTSPISGEHSIEFDNHDVPDTVNPVKAKSDYIQVSRSQVRMERAPICILYRGFVAFLFTCIMPIFIIVFRNSKWRCKITGMKLQSPPHKIISVVD